MRIAEKLSLGRKPSIKDMKKFASALVITHVAYRNNPPYDPIEGPANSICRALGNVAENIKIVQVPIDGFKRPLIYGHSENQKKLKIPIFLGILTPVKYILDIILISIFTVGYNLLNIRKKKLLIGVDPLSCLPLVVFKKIFNYKLVFYSVDFNKNRSKNRILQGLYEWSDKVSSLYSDQAWVVSESLQSYKQDEYKVKSIYIPNAPIFNQELYVSNRHLKVGNKLAWSGSFLTERQFDIFFAVLKDVQSVRPDLEIYLVPIWEREKFEIYCKKYNLKQCQILKMYSRLEWQQFAVKCDIGIAIYDDQFGSTKFIEPLKIWDFMMCGLPFIISKEPSLATFIKNSGVAYSLDFKNKMPSDNSLINFLNQENIKRLQPVCVEIAKRFSIDKQVEQALDSEIKI